VKDDRVALSQVLERIERIDGSGIDRERFLSDPLAQDAIIRNLEVIGEAVKSRISPRAKALSPGVRWRRIAGFRDIAIHGYDRLDLPVVWRIVEFELPVLRRAVRKLLTQLGPPSA
jgi:uncharacterized protein with HEPN domain